MDPVMQFKADLELVSGQVYTDAFILHAFEQHPEYVRQTSAAAAELRSHQPATTRHTRRVDQIKAKYRPVVERIRREEALKKQRAHSH